jgi:prepilin peptidase CpaA
VPLPDFLVGRQWAERLHQHAGIPYGVALAAAALIVYPQTDWMTRIAL